MGLIIVGISDYKIAKPPDTLITYALGSCVGICLLDPAAGVGGLAHIMLPSNSISPNDKNLMKFADTSIPHMVQAMEGRGASRARLTAKIAGGAQMFGTKGGNDDPTWNIGRRNVRAVMAVLAQLGIPIRAQDVLQYHGRTVAFDPATGVMKVTAINKDVQQL